MTEDRIRVPDNVSRAANYTLYRAMVFSRNIIRESKYGPDIVYEIMDAIHEVPNILDSWGTYDNDISKLRCYFGYFKHARWPKGEFVINAPDLVKIFDDKLEEISG